MTVTDPAARETLLYTVGYADALRHVVEELTDRSTRAGQRVADLNRGPAVTEAKPPAYIRTGPDTFRPFELCTAGELDDAAIDRAGQAADLISEVSALLVRARTLRGQPKD